MADLIDELIKRQLNIPVFGQTPMTPEQQRSAIPEFARFGAELLPGGGGYLDLVEGIQQGNEAFRALSRGDIREGLSLYGQEMVNLLGAAADIVPMVGAGAAVAKRVGQIPLDKLVKQASERIAPERAFQRLVDQAGQVDVWHGSPHRFEKFTTEKIGTGEGAQAFGWGLYFTDKKDIAQYYANKLGNNELIINGERLFKNINNYESGRAREYAMNSAASVGSTSKNDIIAHLQELLGDNIRQFNKVAEHSKVFYRNNIDALDEAVKRIKNSDSIEIKPGRNLYKATLHKGKDPSEYTWLDWDKKIPNDQRNKIRNQLEKEFVNINTKAWPDWKEALETSFREEDTQSTYRLISSFFSDPKIGTSNQKEASLFLNRAGIDGIRYPAGSLTPGMRKAYFLKGNKLPKELDYVGHWALDKTMPNDVFKEHLKSQIHTLEISAEKKYQDLAEQLKSAKRSDFTQEAQAHNYVVFDENAVTIEEILNQ